MSPQTSCSLGTCLVVKWEAVQGDTQSFLISIPVREFFLSTRNCFHLARHFWSFSHGQGKVQLLSWAVQVSPNPQLGPAQQPGLVTCADPSFGQGVTPCCIWQARAALDAQEESSSTGVSDLLSPQGCLASALVLLTASPSVYILVFHSDACKGYCKNVMALFLEVWVSTIVGVFLPPLLILTPNLHPCHFIPDLFKHMTCTCWQKWKFWSETRGFECPVLPAEMTTYKECFTIKDIAAPPWYYML